ncbi:MAG: YggS family pyridoxal phosphate-dependent enzyme [Anaerolineae bacterium]|nr:YggS family pyridoxal phosphate-dependent enzyme [Anaerolineae bacterium]
MTDQIHSNVKQVESRIAEAALRAGRRPDDVTLVAVCKTFPADAVIQAFMAGVRNFGENRVSEAQDKIPEVSAGLSGAAPTWHMVGHIQSRKTSDVVVCFDFVHSVDRLKVANRLSRFAAEAGRTLPVLLECNVSGEDSKFGFDVREWESESACREAFFGAVGELLQLRGICIRGLMTMAPLVTESTSVRPVFASLRGLRDALSERFPETECRDLSMGMTNDYEVAVEEGATLVRVGRAIFGVREIV